MLSLIGRTKRTSVDIIDDFYVDVIIDIIIDIYHLVKRRPSARSRRKNIRQFNFLSSDAYCGVRLWRARDVLASLFLGHGNLAQTGTHSTAYTQDGSGQLKPILSTDMESPIYSGFGAVALATAR